ncbi:hypothetical protein HOG48_05425 [Candidatus Peregrinibacteria bacterium]|jgi:hypothetical protein|nr:hypothetical protein [Candidatus Peregrinibacteria bacterium]
MDKSITSIAPDKAREFFKLLKYSTMSRAEKKWWAGLLPIMSEMQLDKLLEILREEVDKVTDLSLKMAQMRRG